MEFDMTIEGFHAALARGEVGPLDWWKACMARVEACESEVGAWQYLAAEAAVPDDAAGDALYGVPVGLKDIIETVAMPTTWGSKGYLESASATMDAAIVTLLERQGALIMGKTVTTEFAYYSPGKTRNPRDTQRTPGGSSSGSAAAVAAGMVPLAFGTQTAGSMIRPASYCGVYGLKPTHGTLSGAGVKGLAPSLDTLGWFTRHVEDICTAFSALTGAPAIAPRESLSGLRMGVGSLPVEIADTDVRLALEAAGKRFATAGAELVPLRLEARFEALVEEHKTVMAYEVAQTLASEYRRFKGKGMSDVLASLIEEGRSLSHAQYLDAQRAADRARQALGEVFGQVDVLLAPSAPGVAPLGEATGDPLYNRAWTLLGVPCLNLPWYATPEGLPVGVQLVGNRREDEALLSVARSVGGTVKRSAGSPRD